ncbi:MAG TPA: hypothetical protein VK036_00565 [Wenzhouxiangella sp.]|nr:hypothetical protein [Wenzhouxiangella sp.]
MSSPVFLVLVACAILLALAFIVLPLRGRRQGSVLAGLAFIVPVATVGLYLVIGTPGAISPQTGQVGEVRSAVTEMAVKAMREPNDSVHWTRLGLAYKSLQDFGAAEHALRRALYIEPQSGFLMAELGETLLYGSGQRQLPAEAQSLLEQAAAQDSQKALWLLGLNARQLGDNKAAETHLARLLEILPEDSEITASVEQQLAAARSGHIVGAGNNQASDHASALTLMVDIDPALHEQLSGDEAVFVAVHNADDQGPPLAATRLRADQLPIEVSLGDDDAMLAGSGISTASTVRVVARVSFSGDAAASEGDFEGHSKTLPVEENMHAEILINRIL